MTTQLSLNDAAFRFRAVPTRGVRLDDDPDVMVQQQFARLRFFDQRLGAAGQRVLDWGCGSGFNCQWLKHSADAREVVGFDLSEGAVRLARQTYPGLEFRIADACDPAIDLAAGTWDRVLSCEVLEHVPDMPAFLANLRRHVAPDGAAFVSTPNRLVFSLGYEPSPVNKEHIKELTREEFLALLKPHFSRVEIFGQRFKDEKLLDAWEAEVQRKIRLCEEGTRWVEKETLRAKFRKWRMVNWAYELPVLRSVWRRLRWEVPARLRRALWPAAPAYRWSDFEFVSGKAPDAVWFCAIVRP
jgi:SAM-dependent methyltransferase